MGDYQLRLRDLFILLLQAALIAMICRSGWSPFSFGVVFLLSLSICSWLRFVCGRRQFDAGFRSVGAAVFTTGLMGFAAAAETLEPLAMVFGLLAGVGIGTLVGVFAIVPIALIPEVTAK